MKKIIILDGQIDIFNTPIQEPIKPKENNVIEVQKKKEDNFSEIINLYKESCLRIVKIVSGALLVEFKDKTMYFNKECKNEFNLNTDVGIMPGDEVIIANDEKTVNEIQLLKLKEINPAKYIKRKGDVNIIIPTDDKTIVITKKGWVIEYKQKPKFKEDEVVILENSKKISSEELKAGDYVRFIYANKECTGIAKSIYNNGETVNVSWDNKHTAFYYKCVNKIS